MIIALDYDGTFTADPQLWREFIINSTSRGHTVYIVTMRRPEECICFDDTIQQICEIIYTSRKAKKSFVELHNMKFDIWIDDNPEWLFIDTI